MTSHMTNSCHYRMVVCEHCSVSYLFIAEEMHMEVCEEVLVECQLCKTDLPRRQLEEHTSDLCPKKLHVCGYADVGCTEKKTFHSTNHMQHITIYLLQWTESVNKITRSMNLDPNSAHFPMSCIHHKQYPLSKMKKFLRSTLLIVSSKKLRQAKTVSFITSSLWTDTTAKWDFYWMATTKLNVDICRYDITICRLILPFHVALLIIVLNGRWGLQYPLGYSEMEGVEEIFIPSAHVHHPSIKFSTKQEWMRQQGYRSFSHIIVCKIMSLIMRWEFLPKFDPLIETSWVTK